MTRSARIALPLLCLLALALAGGAAAEKPANNQRPFFYEGTPPVVGSVLKANNGSWFCNPASACETTTYQFLRCQPNTLVGCAVVQSERASNTYTVQAADAGSSLAVDVFVRGTDCGEINRTTGEQECRPDFGVATSAPTVPVPGTPPAPAAPPPPPPPPPPPTVLPASLPDGVASAPYAKQALTTSAGTGPFAFAVTAGKLPPGLVLSPGGVVTGTPTRAGTFSFTVTATGSGGSTAVRSYALGVRLMMAPLTLPAGVAGTSYAQSFDVVAGGTPPYSFYVTSGSLPPGLSLSSTGVLAGTPTAPGRWGFTVSSSDALGARGVYAYAIEVSLAPLAITTAALPRARAGARYRLALVVRGGLAPYAFALEKRASLTRGLALSPDGVLAGIPRVAGTFRFGVRATDATGASVARSYSLVVRR